jgi:uncharacterized membrane protein
MFRRAVAEALRAKAGHEPPRSADGAGPASQSSGEARRRRGYLDWLRGVAVLVMIEAHTMDAWTRDADRGRWEYGWASIAAGFGAPIFLFLAGIALFLAAGARMRAGADARAAGARAERRALQIFGLAFLFRLQSWLISGGPARSLLKVDILNVMGLSMLAAGLLWRAGRSPARRAALMALGTVAMVTPVVRASSFLTFLPDPVEWYLRPTPGRTTFTLFPWAGFLLAGGAVGVWLDAVRTSDAERRVNAALAMIGLTLALAAYGASFLPPIYAQTNFWTSSPTFFFLRLGVLIALVPIAYVWNLAWTGRSPLQELGVASLFVYWIHVEMVYGVLSTPIHHSIPLDYLWLAFAAFTVFLFCLVKLRDRIMRDWWPDRRPALNPAGRTSGSLSR